MSGLNYNKCRIERLSGIARQAEGAQEYGRIKAFYEELKAKKKDDRLEALKQAYKRTSASYGK
ncbi:MAG: hypothetical protein AAB922_02255 [Patescibacteria group bacterium]